MRRVGTGRRGADVDEQEKLDLVYAEAVRGIVHQQSVVESMNARAGNLTFTAAFATSLLGSSALADGLGPWDWLAISLLFALGILIAFLLWPYRRYAFRFDPVELLESYVTGHAGLSLADVHRALALRIADDLARNWTIIQRLRLGLQASLVLLLIEVAAWVISMASA